MVEPTPFRRPQPERLSRTEFKALVVRLVEEGKMMVSRHLWRDHPERGITVTQIERCLEKGTVQTDPFLNRFGNFQAEMFRHMAGQELTVVAAIEWDRQVVVITAF